jgi:hypothetical protein
LLLARSKFMATRSILGVKPRNDAEVIS